APILTVIHLLEDRRGELLQRPFPIDAAREFREAAHEARDAAEHGQVEVDYVFEAGALNFDRHGLARMQSRAIDLSERRGGYRLRTDFGVKLVERPPQFALDDPHRFVMLERPHAVLPFTQLFYVSQRQPGRAPRT